ALGPIVGGWASDWLERKTGDRRISRQGLAVGCLLICAGLMWVGYHLTDIRQSMAVICLGAFFAAAAGPAAYTVAMELGGKSLAIVFSIMNMWGNVGAAAFPYLIPFVLGNAANRQPTDPPPDWDGVFLVFSLLYVLAAACWIPFNSTRRLFPEHPEREN
ncbi:MAG: MFS transporter, partial [Planctomycetota bacterium]|nr:MFS transporter [Planctomycetota bacterium]